MVHKIGKKERALIHEVAKRLPVYIIKEEGTFEIHKIQCFTRGSTLLSKNPKAKDNTGKPIDSSKYYSQLVPKKSNPTNYLTKWFKKKGIKGLDLGLKQYMMEYRRQKLMCNPKESPNKVGSK